MIVRSVFFYRMAMVVTLLLIVFLSPDCSGQVSWTVWASSKCNFATCNWSFPVAGHFAKVVFHSDLVHLHNQQWHRVRQRFLNLPIKKTKKWHRVRLLWNSVCPLNKWFQACTLGWMYSCSSLRHCQVLKDFSACFFLINVFNPKILS